MSYLAESAIASPEPIVDFSNVHKITDEIQSRLTSFLSSSVENQIIEEVISTEGRKVLNAMHQAFFTAKANEIVTDPVIDTDLVERKHIRSGRTRTIQGVHGEVKVTRTVYRRENSHGLDPLAGHLNLPNEKYTLMLKKIAILMACEMSYEKTQQTLSKLTGNSIPKRQLEEIIFNASKDYKAFYKNSRYPLDDYNPEELLILTFDGKGIKMIPGSLREKTREAAQKQKKSGVRLGKGEKSNRKRMAQVASIYNVSRFERTSEDVIASLRKTYPHRKSPRPRPKLKRVFASVERSAETVIAEGIEEAISRDPEKKMRWFVLVDGDPRQIKSIEKVLNRKHCEATIVMDFIHVTEYVWKAAHAIWGERNHPEKEDWIFEKLSLILQGKSKKVVGVLRREAKKAALSDDAAKPVTDCCRYLKNHYDYLKYNEALRDGAPICTGIIEGACRYLIRDRMELTGCRWSLKGAEAMLCLRSAKVSGDFEEYWSYHCAQEKFRNHLTLYKDNKLPAMALPSPTPKLQLLQGGKSCAH